MPKTTSRSLRQICADIDAFQRLDFINVPPKAVEHELRAGQFMLDRVLGDDELIGKPEPTNLDFEQRINRLRDLVLKLAGAEDADPALRCQKIANPAASHDLELDRPP